jgi:PAS domain-containing protein
MMMAEVSLINLVLNALTVLLGGSALGVFLRYRSKIKEIDAGLHTGDRADNRADFESVATELARQRDDALRRYAEAETRIEKMEAEIQGLRLARDLDPFPSWVVDTQGCYQFVNRAFEEHFLEPIGQTYRDVIGKCHADIWPDAFCRTLKALDAEARKRPDGTARARAKVRVPSLGQCEITVHKFPVRFKPSNAIVAYAGYITDMEPEERTIG